MYFGSMHVLSVLREVVELLSLEVFKQHVDVALRNVAQWSQW